MSWKNNIAPELIERVEKLQEIAQAEGFDIRVVSAYRSHAEQAKLYAQGRTASGKVVTNARAGSSFHNFGLALDLAPFINGKIEWDEKKFDWSLIAKWAKAVGLEAGANWKKPDRPHVQLVSNNYLAKAQILFQKRQSLSDVWEGIKNSSEAKETTTPTISATFTELKKGSKGEGVRKLQTILHQKGFLGASGIDGDFGDKTERAVRAFQMENGLREDGRVGVNTAKKLGLK